MLKTITATELTHNTKSVINDVTHSKDPVVVMNYRDPVAVIIDYASWEKLTQKKAPPVETLFKHMRATGRQTNITEIIRKNRDAE